MEDDTVETEYEVTDTVPETLGWQSKEFDELATLKENTRFAHPNRIGGEKFKRNFKDKKSIENYDIEAKNLAEYVQTYINDIYNRENVDIREDKGGIENKDSSTSVTLYLRYDPGNACGECDIPGGINVEGPSDENFGSVNEFLDGAEHAREARQ